jgi:filamentous hemagglutinin family protein
MIYQNRLKILRLKIIYALSFASLFFPDKVLAQVIPDNTVGTQVIPNLIIQGVSSDLVGGGTIKGANLFHSFSELNIAANRGLYFSNPANITNIFSRVTGLNPSNISGTLGVLGNANLFLQNPNGVIFGENSSLALAGSLYVTTSDHLRFADRTTFSTTNPEPASILTSSIPIGLGFRDNTGMIVVRSQSLPIPPLPLPPETTQLIRTPSGLITLPNTAIALIGSKVNIENNGSLFSLGGVIELGGVRNGEVALIPNGNKFGLSYTEVIKFGNVQLSGNASVNNVGLTEGDIKIVGDRVSLFDRGLVLTGSLGNLFSGKILVQASQLIELVGSNNYAETVLKLSSLTPDFKDLNGLVSFSAGASNGGNISLEAPQVNAREGGVFLSTIIGGGKAGNIIINAPESITLDSSAISTGTAIASTGTAGNVEIQTGSFVLKNNGAINSTGLGTGLGSGDVVINATRSVELFGIEPIFTSQKIPIISGIATATFNSANSGNIQINTPYLNLQDGGTLSTATQGQGNGGTLSIIADRIDLSGSDPSNVYSSGILAFARIGSTGDGGNVNLIAKVINIQNNAFVSVDSSGSGKAGNLSIISDQLILNPLGRILAFGVLAEGGNINLQIRDLLLLQNNSQILASSAGTGNGGNINIKAPIIVGLENSQINANAFSGNGGNIMINTQGLFFSPNSVITASSELGVSGNVAISNLDFSTKNVSIPSVENFVKVDAIVSNSCIARRNINQGSFVVTGSGGLPENPYNLLVAEYPATTIQPVAIPKSLANLSSISSQKDRQNWQLGDAIVEVSGLTRSKNGEILPVVTYADAVSCLKNQ